MLRKLLGNNGRDIEGLLKNTIKIVGQDHDLFYPVVYMSVYRSITVVLSFSSVYFFFISGSGGLGVLSLLALMAYAPVSFFLQVRHQAALTWMTAEVLEGKDSDLDSGFGQLKDLQLKLFIIGLINFFIKDARAQNSESSGFKELIIGVALSVLREVWDLVHNFLLPAIVIDKVNLEEAVPRLKDLKKNIPAAITGVLAVDLLGGIASSVVGTLVAYNLIFLGGLGYLASNYLPGAWVVGSSFNTLPLFFGLFLSSIFTAVILSACDGIKSVYFSIFYMSLNHPLRIKDEMRASVTNYLNYKGKTKAFDFFSKLSEAAPEDKKLEISGHSEVDQDVVEKLKRSMKTNLLKGHDAVVIENFLLKKGFEKSIIAFALNEYLTEESEKIIPFIKTKLAKGHIKEELIKFLGEKGIPRVITDKALKAS